LRREKGMTGHVIAGFGATLDRLHVGGDEIAYWRVDDLERYVDRVALLAGDDPPEPPYWAHPWSGALVLAEAVPADAGTALELGCGLGLPGLVAARRGARVTFVDRVPAALAFVRASAETNGLGGVQLVAADATTAAVVGRFDLVLAAELLYDRVTFPALAAALRDRLAPGGRGLLADAGRIDTRAFYDALGGADLSWRASERVVREEGQAVRMRLIEFTHRRGGTPPTRARTS
jgi:predicted nicotinamide N-methyase